MHTTNVAHLGCTLISVFFFRVGDEIFKYQQEIVGAVKQGWPGSSGKVVVNIWSITTALLYSLTVITTIGKVVDFHL